MPVETIEDHHIKIKPTLKLIEFIIQNLNNHSDLPDNLTILKNVEQTDDENRYLTLDDIKWIKSYLLEHQNPSTDKVYVHDLLDGAKISLPEPKVTPRNSELEARVKKLQAEQDSRDYKAMTKGVDSFRKHLPEDTIAFQLKYMNKQLIAVAQFVLSVIAGFAFGFIGVELIIGNLDFGFRLLLGIMCALVIALAEIYFLAKKLSEDYDEIIPETKPRKLHQE